MRSVGQGWGQKKPQDQQQQRVHEELEKVDESQVVDVVADPFICQICLHVVSLDARLTKCSHWFCSECLHGWMKKKVDQQQTPSCPSCNTNLDPNEIQDVKNCKVVYRQLSCLILRCKNAPEVDVNAPGCCEWVGPYEDYYPHIATCKKDHEEAKRQEAAKEAQEAAQAAGAPPAQPEIIVAAVAAFEAQRHLEDGQPITIKEGDTIIVNQRHESGWTHGQNKTNGTVGWFPRYVLPEVLPEPEATVPVINVNANAIAAKPREPERAAEEKSIITKESKFPYVVRIVEKFEKIDDSSLPLKNGDIVEIIESSKDGKWIYGCCVHDENRTGVGHAGWFPSWILQGNRAEMHHAPSLGIHA